MPLKADFIHIRTGLLAKKHIQKIGGWPMTLYFWLHSQVRFKGKEAGVMIEPYTHERAAKALGLKPNSVKGWFQTLRDGGYVATKPLRRGLEVTITKYGREALLGALESASTDVVPEVQGSPKAAKADASTSGTTAKGEVQGSGTKVMGEVTTSKGEVTTSKGEVQGSPTAPSIKERAHDSLAPIDSVDSPPPNPPAPSSTQSWQTDVIQAFVGVGLPAPDLDGNEGINARKLLKHTTPELLATCWQEIRAGEYGDDAGWLQRNLSFVTLAERQRFTNWLMEKAGKTTPPKRRTNSRANPHDVIEADYQRSLAALTDARPGARKALTHGSD